MQPIYNVEQRPFPYKTEERRLSLESIGAIIEKAAKDEGWSVEKIKPGVINCSLHWKRHGILISIIYSEKDYSIRHLSSMNLKENEGTIHPRYNKFVRLLQRKIEWRFSVAKY